MLLEPRPALMHSQAFVIYVFLQLLITYLGGERSLLITLHGRPPIPHPFPFNWFMSPMDVSDPWTLLKLKRGVLRKSLLVGSIMPRGLARLRIRPNQTPARARHDHPQSYRHVSRGKLCCRLGIHLCQHRVQHEYLSESLVSVVPSGCLVPADPVSCLAMFWVCVSDDLQPFRPVRAFLPSFMLSVCKPGLTFTAKFLCVKGILFFSFWQSVGISFLVAVGAIKKGAFMSSADGNIC